MDKIFNFLVDNLNLVFYVGFFIIEILLILIKKPVKIDSLKEKISEFLPFAIKLTEEMIHSSSADKLNYCLALVKERFRLKTKVYDDFIVSSVESILLTPTKK